MKHLWPALMVALVVAPAAAPVWAQGEFPLKYVDADMADPLAYMSTHYMSASTEKPADLKALPKNTSGTLYYGSVPVGNRQVVVVADSSQPPKVFVDAAGTGDLSAASALPMLLQPESPTYGPVAVTAGKAPVKLFIRYVSAEGEIQVRQVRAGYMAGEVKLGGRSYRAAVIDRYGTGRYDQPLALPVDPNTPRSCPTFAIDLNQNGTFDQNVCESAEVAPLMPMVQVGGTYYSLKVAPDGTKIAFEKVEPKMGTLDVGAGDVAVVVYSDSGWHRFAGSQGKWQVPAGRYTAADITFNRVDKSGATWMMTDNNQVGKFKNFQVAAGEALVMPVGPPLKVKVDASPGGEPGVVSIGLALEGQSGETYVPGLKTSGNRQPPPQLKILDGAGKVLAAGKFEFG